ncbi:hypothetical protein RFI_03680 [Reticulomyxa filosa]|uniref:Uncharacterized protein n=1 Tax=Reticulomyxa filosa TaxID=46433 RepID=X6P5N6_RETFI|nr:hypothetical protein RFI_03680 [Reticulomyxa filosa]|eukprot:ETO33423.1 hypothetical protein RFI_03680 [Reticulomyxa filosa]
MDVAKQEFILWKTKISKVLDTWIRLSTIDQFPKEMHQSIVNFCKKSKQKNVCTEENFYWSAVEKGKLVVHVKEDTIEFKGEKPSVVVSGYTIDKAIFPNYFAYQLQIISPTNKGNITVGINLKGSATLTFDINARTLGGHSLKKPFKDHDTLQFLGELLKKKKKFYTLDYESQKVYLFHNMETYCGAVFERLQNKIVAAISACSPIQCAIQFIDSGPLVPWMKREREREEEEDVGLFDLFDESQILCVFALFFNYKEKEQRPKTNIMKNKKYFQQRKRDKARKSNHVKKKN